MEYLKYTEYDKEPGGIKKLNFVIDAIRDKKGNKAKVLDVGSGNGNVSFPLACLGYDVLAVDISDDLVERNSKKNTFQNLTFKTWDLNTENMPLEEKFDAILLLDILEHLENPDTLLSNLKKLCNNGSLLIISIPNGYGFSEIVSSFVRGIEKRTKIQFVNKFKTMTGRFSVQSDNYTPHLQHFSFGKFVSSVEMLGFRLVEHKNSTVFSSTLRWRGGMEKFDLKLADLMPKPLSSGWYLVFEKE
jgi:SAM-dependent methyltransferase